MSSEAILPFWTGLLSPSRIQPAYPLRELQAATNPFAGTGKLDHALIDNAVVTDRAEMARAGSSLAIGNSLEECGPLNR